MSKIEGLAKETFPAIPVANEVLWVNPKIELPFDLQEGQSCDLGIFLANSFMDQKVLQLPADDIHHRSVLLGTVLIQDSIGNRYYDLDLKGIGYIARVRGRGDLRIFSPRKRGKEDTWGTWRRTKAERERNILEDLAVNANARINRIAAIISLKEISLPSGQTISIEEVRNKGLLRQDEDPVVGLRAYRYRERLRHDSRNSLAYLEKGKEIIGAEIGKELNWEEYLLWFAETLGQNLRTVHSCDYWHGYPSPQNTTFACELVDFGFGEGDKKLSSLSYGQQQQVKQLDFVHARDTLNGLVRTMSMIDLINISNGLFQEVFSSYDEAYQST